eukprot:2441013-Prymnesium_polylepis.1
MQIVNYTATVREGAAFGGDTRPRTPRSAPRRPSRSGCVNGLRGRDTRTWHACGTRERRERGPTQ